MLFDAVFSLKDKNPTAVLFAPVAFKYNVSFPKAVLPVPVVLFLKALPPTATRLPTVARYKAVLPTATLYTPVTLLDNV